MPTLIRKRNCISPCPGPDVGRGARIHAVRHRLVYPQPPAHTLVPGVPEVSTPLPHVPPSCFSMGTDLDTGRELYLRQERFDRQPHLLFEGAPGVGKSIQLLLMIDALLAIPDASLIIANPKGSFGRHVIDLVIARGQAHRLEVLDPSDQQFIPCYNPAHPNSLSWCIHAKQLREGIRQSTNMTSFDIAQQMARILFMFLAMTRLFDLTLAETVQLVRPKSHLRKQLIPKVPDPDLRFALEYFDSLPERRQDELGSSSLARLESFCFDPVIKRITSRKAPSIDIGDIITNHKILVADIRESDPLRVDDARLLLRFLTNDTVAHVFGRSGPITPVYYIADEAYASMTDDLARALDRGREPGLHVWLACQYVDQFILEDGNTRIRDSVMKCIENRIIFRTPDVENAKFWASQLFFADVYTPWAVKHARRSIEATPVETTRKVTGSTHSVSAGTAVADARSTSRGVSESDGTSISRGLSRAESETWNSSDTRGTSLTESEATALSRAEMQARTLMHGEALSEMEGTSRMEGRGQMRSQAQAHADVAMDASTTGLTRVYDYPVAVMPHTLIRSDTGMTGGSASDQQAESEGESRFQAEGSMHVEGRTVQHAEAETAALTLGRTDTSGRATTVSHQHTEGSAFGITLTASEERGHTHTTTTNETATSGITHTSSREESRGTSESEVPFITFEKKPVVLDVQYLSEDEQMNLKAQDILRMPNQCYFLQLATLPTRRMRAQDWRMPALSDEARAAEWLAIHSRPTYTPLATIEAEEQERNTSKGTGARTTQHAADADASPEPPPRPNFWS